MTMEYCFKMDLISFEAVKWKYIRLVSSGGFRYCNGTYFGTTVSHVWCPNLISTTTEKCNIWLQMSMLIAVDTAVH